MENKKTKGKPKLLKTRITERHIPEETLQEALELLKKYCDEETIATNRTCMVNIHKNPLNLYRQNYYTIYNLMHMCALKRDWRHIKNTFAITKSGKRPEYAQSKLSLRYAILCLAYNQQYELKSPLAKLQEFSEKISCKYAVVPKERKAYVSRRK